jgi:pyridoxal 5'-phosphate synthase pdxS subunit
MIDESEVLTVADEEAHVDKRKFKVPFVCGAYDLGQALRRIDEGAAMIRTKGEAGTGNVVEAIRHIKLTKRQIAELAGLRRNGLEAKAQEYRVPLELVEETAKLQRLPVVWFAAGGIASPPDAAMVMQLGVDGVFVGSGIFKSSDPPRMARAIVEATRHYDEPEAVLEACKNLPQPMKGIDIKMLKEEEKLQTRGI